MKLKKKEREKISLQVKEAYPTQRGATWVGIRPSVQLSKKYNKKNRRQEGRRICQQY